MYTEVYASFEGLCFSIESGGEAGNGIFYWATVRRRGNIREILVKRLKGSPPENPILLFLEMRDWWAWLQERKN